MARLYVQNLYIARGAQGVHRNIRSHLDVWTFGAARCELRGNEVPDGFLGFDHLKTET